MGTSNMTVYAHWEANSVTYSLDINTVHTLSTQGYKYCDLYLQNYNTSYNIDVRVKGSDGTLLNYGTFLVSNVDISGYSSIDVRGYCSNPTTGAFCNPSGMTLTVKLHN